MAVADAHIPVWTKPANVRRARVLVAFHGTPRAWAALRHGVAVAVEQRALLTVAMVCAQPRFGDAAPLFPCPAVSIPYECDQQATRILAGAIEVVPPDVSVVSVLLRGGVASAIAAHAELEGHDLVVMGRGERWFRRAIGSAVAARTSVEVVTIDAAVIVDVDVTCTVEAHHHEIDQF